MITIEKARKLYTDDDPVHDFYHILRVLNLAEHLAEKEGADLEIVRAAVLLHDISRDAEGDHSAAAGDLASEYLAGQSAEFIEAVQHAIRSHRYSDGESPQTLEAKVVFDADKLDSIGAVGVARAFAFAGLFGHPLYVEADPSQTYTQADRDTSAYHEYLYKLRYVAGKLHTESAKRIAEERHAFMVAFFDRLGREVNGEV